MDPLSERRGGKDGGLPSSYPAPIPSSPSCSLSNSGRAVLCAMGVDLNLSPGHPAPLQCHKITSVQAPGHLCTGASRSRGRERGCYFVSQSSVIGLLQIPPYNGGGAIFWNWKDWELKPLKVWRKESCPIFCSLSHWILIKTSPRRNLIKNWLHNVVFVNLCSGLDTTPNQTINIPYLLTTGNYIWSFMLKRGAF